MDRGVHTPRSPARRATRLTASRLCPILSTRGNRSPLQPRPIAPPNDPLQWAASFRVDSMLPAPPGRPTLFDEDAAVMLTTDLGACEWFVWDLRRSNLIERGQLDQ